MHLTRSLHISLRRLRKEHLSLQKLKGCCCGSTAAEVPSSSKEEDRPSRLHVPVLVKEVLERLNPEKGKTYIDMTFGAGGHTKAILEREQNIQIFALDRDPHAHSLATKLALKSPQVIPIPGKFSDAGDLLESYDIGPESVDGILFDLGASSMQFDARQRGFSVSMDGPLDMRMDGNRFPDQPSAADVVNHLDVSGLTQILKKYGEEREAKKIAQAIVDSRNAFGRIQTTRQLADIVSAVTEGRHSQDKLGRPMHRATKTFQALRIFVNNELNELNNGLETAYKLLKPGGICVVISFHSLEDRIPKRHFHDIDMDEIPNRTMANSENYMTILSEVDLLDVMKRRWEPVSKKVIVPSEEEVQMNPRARSAKLRAAIKQPV